jgi:hypothetical protein
MTNIKTAQKTNLLLLSLPACGMAFCGVLTDQS